LKKYKNIKGSEEIFEVTEQYEIKKLLENDSNGVIVLAYDKINNKNVSIKKINKAFQQGFIIYIIKGILKTI
jgi:serine/threonine protein kinase